MAKQKIAESKHVTRYRIVTPDGDEYIVHGESDHRIIYSDNSTEIYNEIVIPQLRDQELVKPGSRVYSCQETITKWKGFRRVKEPCPTILVSRKSIVRCSRCSLVICRKCAKKQESSYLCKSCSRSKTIKELFAIG